MSYIVKNCPCVKHSDEIELDNRCMSTQNDKLFFCENNTNCVMKQIVEKCKNMKQSAVTTALRVFANELLQLLDIQEVE